MRRRLLSGMLPLNVCRKRDSDREKEGDRARMIEMIEHGIS